MQFKSKNLITTLLVLASLAAQPTFAENKKKQSTKKEPAVSAEKELDTLKNGDTSVWSCDNKLEIKTASSKNGGVLLIWDKKLHKLQLKEALPGAQRFIEPTSKLELLIIPDKSMLFDSKAGQRLVDYCKTQEMAQGGKPPVYNNPQ
jgi:hypothetical protein